MSWNFSKNLNGKGVGRLLFESQISNESYTGPGGPPTRPGPARLAEPRDLLLPVESV